MFRLITVVVALVVPSSLMAQPLPSELCRALTSERVKYTVPLSPQQLGTLLNDVALQIPGTFLLPKPAGNNCPLPDGVLISCDYVVRSGLGWDVIGDSEGAAVVVCGDSTGPVSSWVAPVPRQTEPLAPPPLPSCDLGPVVSRLIDLQAGQSRLTDVLVNQQHLLGGMEAIYYLVEADKATDEADAVNLSEHRKAVQEEYGKAKSFVRRWVVEKILPVVGGIVAGWLGSR